MLGLATQAAAAAMEANHAPTRSPAEQVRDLTLDERLRLKMAAAHKYRGKVRFWQTNRRLLSSAEHGTRRHARLAYAKRRLAQLEQTISQLRVAIRRRDARREARHRAAMPPRRAICDVFDHYCKQALAVAWCESRLTTTARNGQYLGLFQMGSNERRLFGHGPTAYDQSEAAHRYFVLSGRDWSPWGCRWAAL